MLSFRIENINTQKNANYLCNPIVFSTFVRVNTSFIIDVLVLFEVIFDGIETRSWLLINEGVAWIDEYVGVTTVEVIGEILDRSRSLLKLIALNIIFLASCLSKNNSSDAFILRSMQSMSSFPSVLNIPKKEKVGKFQ